jgi:arylsulfatase A-like enzyme
MKKFLILGVVLFTGWLGIFAPLKAQSPKPKNVLFIFVDDLNDYVGAFGGHPQALTPNLDKLAQKSVAFQRAYCTSPICVPSRTSIMTGRRPHETKITNNIDGYFRNPDKPEWMQSLITLPQYFKNNGYETLTVGKVYHFSISGGSNRDSISWSIEGRTEGTYTPINNRRVPNTPLEFSATVEKMEDTDDWRRADFAVKHIRENHEKPFFIACGFSRPHLPFYVPQEFFNKFNLNNTILPPYKEDDLDDLRLFFSNRHLDQVQKVNRWKDLVRAYLASMAYVDACIGYLLDELAKSPHKDNTMIVLMGDHGYMLGQKKHFQKFTMWDQAMKTPLIIYDPELKTAGNCYKTVSLQDVYPTLVEMCKLPTPEHTIRGKSLKPLLINPNEYWRGAALSSFSQDKLEQPDSHTIRTDRYRYILYHNGDEELYDHYTDHNEWTNLAYLSDYELIKKELKALLMAGLAGNEDPLADLTPPNPPSLSLVNKTNTTIKLQWQGASDNVGIREYTLYKDNLAWLTTSQTEAEVPDLEAFTEYNFQVLAKDSARNSSDFSNLLKVKTEPNPRLVEDLEINKVYPNPSLFNPLKVEFSHLLDRGFNYYLVDLNGVKVFNAYQNPLYKPIIDLNIGNLARGVYFLHFEGLGVKSRVFRIIKD